MDKDQRRDIAQQTLKICGDGSYELDGQLVRLESTQRKGVFFGDEEWPKLAKPRSQQSKYVFANESTVTGVFNEHGQGRIASLNFASARKPGGGFLNGAVAQEEALCYSSTLYPSLLEFPSFYDKHQDGRYSDNLIYSPDVVFFRDEELNLCKPAISDVITIAAPNAGALNSSAGLEEIFLRRIHKICDVAADNNVTSLILGAWGCGVFKNDPYMVAKCFATVLPKFGIKRVRFSILGDQLDIFKEVLGEQTIPKDQPDIDL